ncbi:hypothetical protein [Bradyrhizobium niftali]|jgi:hypothetical protein|uniref:Porin n=1 Tax=Bradyrhizobium niftali TaxID=2560055 RepID=A0A4Y9LEK5_9BRAD|nr:hypothetical protein [Bradyrhizobium niftali]TFV41359.1 hypothetical protein E4K65_36315 [Bradyrhizobium niftali]
MKPLIGLVVLLFATTAALAQSPPKAPKKPPVQAKPQAPLGCKLVGTVRGIKIWAGDCIAAAASETSPPPSPAEPPGAVNAPAEKQ